MRCYRKILHISYKDHVTNEEIRAKIQQAIGPHEALLTIVKRRKLQWYGHVSRSSGLAETILQQCKAQWKGEELQEDRADKGRGGKTILGNGQAWSSASPRGQWRTGKKWKKLVAKSSVVPQRPSRLRDWWWWWWRTVHEVSYSSTYTRSVSGVCSIVWLKRRILATEGHNICESETPLPLRKCQNSGCDNVPDTDTDSKWMTLCATLPGKKISRKTSRLRLFIETKEWLTQVVLFVSIFTELPLSFTITFSLNCLNDTNCAIKNKYKHTFEYAAWRVPVDKTRYCFWNYQGLVQSNLATHNPPSSVTRRYVTLKYRSLLSPLLLSNFDFPHWWAYIKWISSDSLYNPRKWYGRQTPLKCFKNPRQGRMI